MRRVMHSRMPYIVKPEIAIFLFVFSSLSCATEVFWSEDKKALAFCDKKENKTQCFVVCNNQATNVSDVELSNLGKIGKYNYERVITLPYKWESNDTTSCMFLFETQAWFNNQQLSAKEPVWVSDGSYRGR